MKPSYTKADQRTDRAYRRLGTRTPICTCCGEAYVHALERHHIAGRPFHDDDAIVCRNCHRKLSDPQVDRENLDCTDPWLETVGRYLCGLGELLALVAATLIAFGKELLGIADEVET